MIRFQLRPTSISGPEGRGVLLRAGLQGDLPARQGSRPVLLSRALYRIRGFDLSRVSSRDRPAALRHLVAAWAPFEEASCLVGLQGSHATAMAWDAADVGKMLETANLPPGVQLLPEWLVRAPGAPGVRLLAALEGYEGQVWSAEGALVHSHWWPAEPSAQEWETFLRHREAVKWPGAAAHPVQVPWLGRPWLKVSPPDRWVDPLAAGARRIGPVLVGALGVMAGIQAHDYASAFSRLRSAELEQTVLAEKSQPWGAAREEARKLSDQGNRIAAALRGPQGIEVLAELTQGLPAKGVTLQELSLDGSVLRLTLDVAPDVPRAALVGNLQATGYFSEVREIAATQPGGSLGFSMKVTGRP